VWLLGQIDVPQLLYFRFLIQFIFSLLKKKECFSGARERVVDLEK